MFMNFWCPPLFKSLCVGDWNEYELTERQLWLPFLCVILTALRFQDWTLKFCAVTVFWNLTHKNKCDAKFSHRASCSLVKNSQRKVNYKSYSTIRLISYTLQKCYLTNILFFKCSVTTTNFRTINLKFGIKSRSSCHIGTASDFSTNPSVYLDIVKHLYCNRFDLE